MIQITQRPSQNENSIVSTWNAVGNPILYKMQRQDYDVDLVNNNGKVGLLIFSKNVTSILAVGTVIFLRAYGEYGDLFLKVANVNYDGVDSYIEVVYNSSGEPVTFLSEDLGYIFVGDLHSGYSVSVNIYKTDGNELLNESPITIAPNTKGEMLVEISTFLKPYLSPDIAYDFGAQVVDDTNVYVRFYIEYMEVWTGSSNSFQSDSANTFFSVLAANQIPAPHGGNMIDFLGNNLATKQGKFLTPLEKYPYWEGWPLYISFITSEFVTDLFSVRAIGDDFDNISDLYSQTAGTIWWHNASKLIPDSISDTGKNFILTVENSSQGPPLDASPHSNSFVNEDSENGTVSWQIDTTQGIFRAYFPDGGTSSDLLTDFATSPCNVSKGIVNFDASFNITVGNSLVVHTVYFSFFNSEGEIILTTNQGFFVSQDGEYTFSKEIEFSEDVSTVKLSVSGTEVVNSITSDFNVTSISITREVLIIEPKPVYFRRACNNPVMLVGRNKNGGILQWLFEGSQDITFSEENGTTAKRVMLYTDGLTLQEWEALHDFITYGQVYREPIQALSSSTIKTKSRVGQQVYVVDQDGGLTGVIVIPTKNQTTNRKRFHSFQIEIEYPEVFSL